MGNWREYFQPKPDLEIWEWAERDLIFSDRYPTARKGRFSIDNTPSLKGIFEAIKDVKTKIVSCKKGTQGGLTTLNLVCSCYYSKVDPRDQLVVMPAADEAQELSEERLQVLIQDSPAMASVMTDNQDDFKKLKYQLRRNTITLVGAGSPSKLGSKATSFLITDEEDKYREKIKSEGNVVKLASERMKTYWNRKHLRTCSSTVKGSYIDEAYHCGDQRKFFIPCPHCGHRQVLDFTSYKWDNELEGIQAKLNSAHIECVECGESWSEMDRRGAILAASRLPDRGWIPTAEPKEEGHVSFHHPSFISLWVSIRDVVNEFLSSKDDPTKLQNFRNSWEGEDWEEIPKDNVSISQVFDIRDSNLYPRGTVPTKDEVIVFITCDRQKRTWPWCLWAANRDNLWLVDHSQHVDFRDVWRKFEQPIKNANGDLLMCSRLFLDTGYEATDTYEYCFKHSQIVPLKGDNGTQTTKAQPFTVSKIYPKQMQPLSLVRVHPSFFKYQLLDAMHQNGSMKIWFHEDIDLDFAEQITGEVLVEELNTKTNMPRQYFKVVHKPQDYFDCAQYALCALHMGRGNLKRLKVHEEPVKADEQPDSVVDMVARQENNKFVPPSGRKRVTYG